MNDCRALYVWSACLCDIWKRFRCGNRTILLWAVPVIVPADLAQHVSCARVLSSIDPAELNVDCLGWLDLVEERVLAGLR